MEQEIKKEILKGLNNLKYNLNEILDMYHHAGSVTPEIREEIQDAVDEWGRILSAFKKEEMTEENTNLFNPHIDSVTHFVYNMYQNHQKTWLINVSKALSSLQRFTLVFRTEMDIVSAEKTSVFQPSIHAPKLPQVPVPVEFLRYAVFKENPTAFQYYAKLAEMGECATQKQLAEEIGVAPPTVSAMMSKLAKDGFVDSKRNKETLQTEYTIKKRIDFTPT